MMFNFEIDLEKLRAFERDLDPVHPENSKIPAKVLGYGEISTVLEIEEVCERDVAFKRLPMFSTVKEAQAYEALFREYLQVLGDEIGLQIVPSSIVRFVDEETRKVIVYIVQDKLSPEAIGHIAIHQITREEVMRLVRAVLRETKKVFDFNRTHKGSMEFGLDGQISNWGIVDYNPENPRIGDDVQLVYFDTSTPLMQKDGLEQLNPDLFLRSAPSFLVWIIRMLFLEDVMTRYYDFRHVVIDLIANFYKEQRREYIPALVDLANDFFDTEIRAGEFERLTVKEVESYYREDALIWRFYLSSRKIDRALHRLIGKDYPYILPDKIRR